MCEYGGVFVCVGLSTVYNYMGGVLEVEVYGNRLGVPPKDVGDGVI